MNRLALYLLVIFVGLALGCSPPSNAPASDAGSTVSDKGVAEEDSGGMDSDTPDATRWDAAEPAARQEFPSAAEGIKRLSYSRADGIVPCDPREGFRGDITISNGTDVSILVVDHTSGEREETRFDVQLSREQKDTLQELVLDIPRKVVRDEHNCEACDVSTLRVGDESVGRVCCGVCNEDFQPAFDEVADFLVGLVPTE